MPINARITTADPNACRLDKSNATEFTVQVANQTVAYQLNTSPFGRGENWNPNPAAYLVPGLWNFSQSDFTQYGVSVVQGIRFSAVDPANPGIVTIS